ncbi:MAG: hypothetical protein GYB35_08125 [Algicola sp.]|nr:hypothetical protein [Algicola sp.]
MKNSFFLIFIVILISSCSSSQLSESWKNPDIDIYEPYKVLVVGLTSDTVARQQFENKLKNELELRDSEAILSVNILKADKMTEADLDALESQLLQDGYDTILLTKVIGIEDKVSNAKVKQDFWDTHKEFKDDYLKHQDIYNNPDYYNKYKVYKAETSMYCICPTKDRQLIWKGNISITDPQSQSIEKTINDYVRLVIVVLEEEQLIKPLKAE